MAENTWESDDYNTQLIDALKPVFRLYINPLKLLPHLRRHDNDVLNDEDQQSIINKFHEEGRLPAAMELLERMAGYPKWYPCLLETLMDPIMNRMELAEEIIELEESLHEKQSSSLERQLNKGNNDQISPPYVDPCIPEDIDLPSIKPFLSQIQKSIDDLDRKVSKSNLDVLQYIAREMKMLKQTNVRLQLESNIRECNQRLQNLNQELKPLKPDLQKLKQEQAEMRLLLESKIEECNYGVQNLTDQVLHCNHAIDHLEDIVLAGNASIEKIQTELTDSKTKLDYLEIGVSQSNDSIEKIQAELTDSRTTLDKLENGVSHSNDGITKLDECLARNTNVMNKLQVSQSDSLAKAQKCLTGLAESSERSNTKVSMLTGFIGRVEKCRMEQMDGVKKAINESKEMTEKLEETVKETTAKVEETVNEMMEKVEETVKEATEKVEETVKEGTEKVEETVKEGTEKVEETVKEATEKVEETVKEATEKVEETVKELTVHVQDTIEDSTYKTKGQLDDVTQKIEACKAEADLISQHISNQLVKDIEQVVTTHSTDTKQVLTKESSKIKKRIHWMERMALEAIDKEGELLAGVIKQSGSEQVAEPRQEYTFEFVIEDFEDRVGSGDVVYSHRWKIPQWGSTLMGRVIFNTDKTMDVGMMYGRYPRTVGLPEGSFGVGKYRLSCGCKSRDDWVLIKGGMTFNEQSIELGYFHSGNPIVCNVSCDKVIRDADFFDGDLTLRFEIFDLQ